jgi:hypothetical protein
MAKEKRHIMGGVVYHTPVLYGAHRFLYCSYSLLASGPTSSAPRDLRATSRRPFLGSLDDCVVDQPRYDIQRAWHAVVETIAPDPLTVEAAGVRVRAVVQHLHVDHWDLYVCGH